MDKLLYNFRLEEMSNERRVHADPIHINYSVLGESYQFFFPPFYSLSGERNNRLIFNLSATNELCLAFGSIKHGCTEVGCRLPRVIQEHGDLGQGLGSEEETTHTVPF